MDKLTPEQAKRTLAFWNDYEKLMKIESFSAFLASELAQERARLLERLPKELKLRNDVVPGIAYREGYNAALRSCRAAIEGDSTN